MIAPVLVAPPLLLLSAPGLFALPALAPLLGLAGAAAAFPLLAGQVSSAWRRVALGALGVLAVGLAEPLLDRRLLAGPPAGTPPPKAWTGSADAAVHHVLGPR